jgi:hypothetical protein
VTSVCVTDFLTVSSYDTKIVRCILRHFQVSERSSFFGKLPASFVVSLLATPSSRFVQFLTLPEPQDGYQKVVVLRPWRKLNATRQQVSQPYQNRAFRGASGNDGNPATLDLVCMCLPEFREHPDPPTVCSFSLMGCL